MLVELGDSEAMAMLPQGTAGMVAVYSQRGKSVHIITRVLMRMHAGLGYLINPAT